MNIEHHINHMIHSSPICFRIHGNMQQSRLKVLEHMFFVIGNGYEWNRNDGILECYGGNTYLEELPHNFINKELYDVRLTSEGRQQEVIDKLSKDNTFFYVANNSVIFESNKKYAKAIQKIVEPVKRSSFYDCVISLNGFKTSSDYDKYYPISKHSAMCELIDGRTNSYHIDNYNFDEYPPNKQWVDACLELVLAARDHYKVNYANSEQMEYLTRFIDKFGG